MYPTVRADQVSTIKLYFTRNEDDKFSELYTISATLMEGENKLVFPLTEVGVNGRLRIDPGAVAGHYLVKSLQIRVER